jgi:hypothetical protein
VLFPYRLPEPQKNLELPPLIRLQALIGKGLSGVEDSLQVPRDDPRIAT